MAGRFAHGVDDPIHHRRSTGAGHGKVPIPVAAAHRDRGQRTALRQLPWDVGGTLATTEVMAPRSDGSAPFLATAVGNRIALARTYDAIRCKKPSVTLIIPATTAR